MSLSAPGVPTGRRVVAVRFAMLVVTGVLLTLGVLWSAQLWLIVYSHGSGVGVDLHQYQEHARRWLDTGQLYLPRQLAGPTSVMDGDPLYPPTILYLLVPFLWLPELVWWLVPLAVLAYALIRFRPRMWTWPLLAAVLAWPRTPALIFYGNPGMWMDAAIAAGLLWAWPSALVLLKPSLGPFALLGIRHRSWWVAVGVVILLSIPFGGLWLDYLSVLRNSGVSITYSVLDLPLAIAPIIAWLGRRDPSVGVAPPWAGLASLRTRLASRLVSRPT